MEDRTDVSTIDLVTVHTKHVKGNLEKSRKIIFNNESLYYKEKQSLGPCLDADISDRGIITLSDLTIPYS